MDWERVAWFVGNAVVVLGGIVKIQHYIAMQFQQFHGRLVAVETILKQRKDYRE